MVHRKRERERREKCNATAVNSISSWNSVVLKQLLTVAARGGGANGNTGDAGRFPEYTVKKRK